MAQIAYGVLITDAAGNTRVLANTLRPEKRDAQRALDQITDEAKRSNGAHWFWSAKQLRVVRVAMSWEDA